MPGCGCLWVMCRVILAEVWSVVGRGTAALARGARVALWAMEVPMKIRIGLALGSLVGTLLFGMLTFRLLFHDPWLTAWYLTVAVMATVGDSRIRPLTTAQTVFTGGLIVFGAAFWMLSLSILVSHFLALDLGYFRERRLMMQIKRWTQHFVVVGAGRVGTSIAQELMAKGENVIIVDTLTDRIDRAKEAGLTAVLLHSLTTEAFQTTHLEEAKGIALALADDAQNLYAYLAARRLNQHLQVVARAQSMESAEYLRSLGIERIILPEVVGGRRMARMLTKPVAHDLLMALLNEEGAQVNEEQVEHTSAMANQPVKKVRDVYGDDFTLIGYWRSDSFKMAPKASDVILPGDTLVLIQGVAASDF
jgi:voltage-gated potassium channel